jgi:predicted ester cyclase
MRIYTTMAVAIALAAAPGCKKDKAGDGGGSGAGTAAVGSGSAGSGSDAGSAGSAAAVAPLSGAALGQHYLACLESLGTGTLDAYKGCLADNFAVRDAGHGADAILQRDAALAMHASIRKGFPDMKLTPQLVMVNGRNVAAVVLVTGTHTAPLDVGGQVIPATGKKLGMLFFHRIRFDDANKQHDEWFIDDSMTMMNQLGIAPKEAAGMGRPLTETSMEGAPILAVSAGDAKETTNRDAYAAGVAAVNKHDAAAFSATLDDKVVESDLADTADATGKAQLEQNLTAFLAAFSDAKVETSEVFAAGDYVVAIGTFSGTFDKAMGPIKPTNKKVSTAFAEVAQFTDGKLSRMWRFRNSLDMLTQLGLIPPMAIAPGGGSAGSGSAGSGSATK